ncbi:MAG: exo-alpha-sialidase [Clostridiales bacterium]|nr:exo-alpha-sialidase [Clostridiales bacterium]
MKHIPSEKSVVCANQDGYFGYFGWPSVIRLPDGRLAAVASGFRMGHVCPFGKAVICYSSDEGQTWTLPAPVIDTPLDDRDAGIVCFGDRGVMLTSFTLGSAFYKRVYPNRNENKRTALIHAYLDALEETGMEQEYLGSTYRLSLDGGTTFGPLQFAPVSTPHGPIRLLDGTLLYVGRRYSPVDLYTDMENPILQVWHMDEQGYFEKLSDIENIRDEHGWYLVAEPHGVQLPDGKILVHIRVQREGPNGKFTLYQCESTDGGRHFNAPHQILPDVGGAPGHLLLHSSGRLIGSYGYRESPFGVRLMFSDDGGESWDYDYVLEKDGQGKDLGYPATVELLDGGLLTVYYQSTYSEDGSAVSSIMQRKWRLPDK